MGLTVTADDLHAGVARFAAEATWGELATPRYRMRYASWGSGPPLVIVHGMCDVPRSFSMLMRELAGDFRCVALSLPDGHADGAHLHAYRHPDYARDLVALFDHLGLDRADLLGSSFGSTVALRTAHDFPARVRRVVLQGGFPRRPLVRVERWLARLGRSWTCRMGELPTRNLIMRLLERGAFVSAPPEVFRFLIGNSGRTPVRAAAQRARMLETLDLRPLLLSIRHPVLMVGGDRDAIVPRRYEAEAEAGLPDVRRVEFAPCGHYPQYTHPRPMANAIRRFLNA